MTIFTQFKNLLENLKSHLFIEPRFYKVLQDNHLTSEEKLAIIKKEKLLEQLSIDTFNNKSIDGFSVNALTHCISQGMYNLATYFLTKEGIDYESKHNSSLTFDTIMKYIMVESSEEFFKTLFSQKIELKKINPNEKLYLLFSDAANESTILGFINCLNIDLKQSFHSHVFHGALDFIKERLHVSDQAINAILNSEQFSLEEIEELSLSIKNNIRGDNACKLIDLKIINMIEKEKDFLESHLNQSNIQILDTKSKKKQKI